MRAVNRPLLLASGQVTRLDRAVNYLGLRTVKSLIYWPRWADVLSQPTSAGMTRDLCGTIAWGLRFWCANWRWHQSAVIPREAFLAGIMHDIAIPLLAQVGARETYIGFRQGE